MKLKYNTEMISGAVFGVLAVILWLLIPSQIDTMETTVVTAQTVPKIVIGGMFIFSAILFIQGLMFAPKTEVIVTAETFKTNKFKREMKSVIYAGIIIGYGILLTLTNFVIASVGLVFAILLFYGARKWYYYAIPLSTIAIVYYVFKVVLNVTLP